MPAYATLTDLKQYLRVLAGETSDDALLTRLLDAATATCESETGRVFVAVEEAKIYSAYDLEFGILYLWDSDIISVTSIKTSDGTVIPGADIQLLPSHLKPAYALELKPTSVHSLSGSSFEITGKWGFSLTVPEDIKQAVIRHAVWMYRQKDSSADTERPLLTGDGVTIMPSSVPQDVLAVYRRYRRAM